MTMLGLKAPPPDPAARITAADLVPAWRALSRPAAPAASAGRPDEPARPHRGLAARAERPRARCDAATRPVCSPPRAPSSSRLASARRYQEGVSWAGVCFAAYNLVAFGFSFLLLALVKRSSARSIHVGCLALGGLGLLSVLAVREPSLLLASMVGIGVAWASILAMPYAMLSNALPAAKMGFYMGVFNFFIVLPQILASVGLGWVMERFLGNDATKALLLGGVSMLLAALLTLRVKKEETE